MKVNQEESRLYAKFTLQEQAAIGEYASLHGNQAAICHFSKQLGVDGRVQCRHGKGAEVSRKRKATIFRLHGNSSQTAVQIFLYMWYPVTTASTEKAAILTPVRVLTIYAHVMLRRRGNGRRACEI